MDPTPEPTSVPRPKEVTLAVRLLLLSIVMGLLTSAIHVAQKVSGMPLLLALLIVVAFFAVYLFLVNRIGARNNWARIVFLVLVLFGLPFTVPTYIGELRKSVLSGLFSILITLLQLIGAYLLFKKNSNQWFRTRK